MRQTRQKETDAIPLPQTPPLPQRKSFRRQSWTSSRSLSLNRPCGPSHLSKWKYRPGYRRCSISPTYFSPSDSPSTPEFLIISLKRIVDLFMNNVMFMKYKKGCEVKIFYSLGVIIVVIYCNHFILYSPSDIITYINNKTTYPEHQFLFSTATQVFTFPQVIQRLWKSDSLIVFRKRQII